MEPKGRGQPGLNSNKNQDLTSHWAARKVGLSLSLTFNHFSEHMAKYGQLSVSW